MTQTANALAGADDKPPGSLPPPHFPARGRRARAAARHRDHRRLDRAAGDQRLAPDHQHCGHDGLATRTTRAPTEIKRALITFQSVITALESAQRGYLLTGQTGYLEPYHVAMRSWRKQIDRLRELTVDDPFGSRTSPRWKG